MITIFTDGSSRGNPGPGGWGTIILDGMNVNGISVTELGGGEKNTTNNRMELTAVVQAFNSLESVNGSVEDQEITVFTDSAYVINGITKWVHGWKRNGWITKAKEDVLNKDLWLELMDATEGRKIVWKRISGHAGIIGNERCDEIATAFADGGDVKLYEGLLVDYSLPNIMNISVDEEKEATKKSSSSHSRAKAYSYVSSVGGVIQIHHSWPDCERRVKGTKGARYKKAVSREDEEAIKKEFI